MINISDKYRIERKDDQNIVIEQFFESKVIKGGKHKDEMSEATWKQIGYYPTIKHALRAAVLKELGRVIDLEKILDKLADLESKIESLEV
jgi:hypothetical protein